MKREHGLLFLLVLFYVFYWLFIWDWRPFSAFSESSFWVYPQVTIGNSSAANVHHSTSSLRATNSPSTTSTNSTPVGQTSNKTSSSSSSLKIVVVMVSDVLPEHLDDLDNVEDNYVSLTVVMNWIWAKRHGYDFHFVHQTGPCFHRKWGPRLNFWCRQLDFLSILENAEEKKWDWLLYLDSDAFVPNPNSTFEDILKIGINSKQSGVEDWFNGSYTRGVEDPHVILTKDVDNWPGTCFGVQAWRNSAISKEIMCDLFNSGLNQTTTVYPDGKIEVRRKVQTRLFAEQGVMNQLLLEVLKGGTQRPNWEKHIAIGSAHDLYWGGVIFHAALGSPVFYERSTGRRCGNDAPKKLHRCIKPAWDRIYKHEKRGDVREILIRNRTSYEEPVARYCSQGMIMEESKNNISLPS